VSETRRASDSGNPGDVVDDRIEANEERVKENPDNAQARKELVQDYYSKAASLPVQQAGRVPPEGQDELRKAGCNYQAYLELKPEPPDASLALIAIELYGPGGRDEPKKLQEAWPRGRRSRPLNSERPASAWARRSRNSSGSWRRSRQRPE